MPALGLKVPDPVLTQPGLDAINPSIGPVEILAGAVIARGGGRAALSALQKILADSRSKKAQIKEPTKHGAERSQQRNISQSEINKAIETSKKSNTYEEKIGKYGTKQIHYKGSNGITVIVELEGRNAGKVITVYRNGK